MTTEAATIASAAAKFTTQAFAEIVSIERDALMEQAGEAIATEYPTTKQ